MLKYRGSKLARAGFVGVVVAILAILVGLAPDRLIQWASAIRYEALFVDGGGLVPGNDVTLSGIKVGTVRDISLQGGDALVKFTVEGRYTPGSDTSAHIRTGTLLGERVLVLDSAGDGRLDTSTAIPTSRTSSPYSLTDAVGELTTNTAGTDTASLNASLDTLSATIDQISPQLGPTFDGLTRLSEALNGRNQNLSNLLRSAGEVTGILSERSQQVNSLILNANDLVGVLSDRRTAIANLLASTAAVSRQLKGVVADNEAALAPSLERLNRVTDVLQRNRDNISKTLVGFKNYQVTQGETVASGAYYNAYVPNLAIPELLQPFLDYAFGFRRGVDAGQPPDNAGPRAEFQAPFNANPPK